MSGLDLELSVEESRWCWRSLQSLGERSSRPKSRSSRPSHRRSPNRCHMLCFCPFSSEGRPSRVGLQELLAREMAIRFVLDRERLDHPAGRNSSHKSLAGSRGSRYVVVPPGISDKNYLFSLFQLTDDPFWQGRMKGFEVVNIQGVSHNVGLQWARLGSWYVTRV